VVSTLLLVTTLAPTSPRAATPDGSRELAAIADEYWQGTLRRRPLLATALGERRFDASLEDISPAGYARERERLEATRAALRSVDAARLSADDRLTAAILEREVRDRLDLLACRDEEWVVDPFGGPQATFMNLPSETAIETPAHAADYVARCRAMGPWLDQHVANLERGLAARRVAPAAEVRNAIRNLDGMLARPADRWPLLAPLAAERPGWSPGARDSFRVALEGTVREIVGPAFERYRAFLDQRVLPRARANERAGLSFMPGGLEVYRTRLRVETSLDSTPEALHRIGLEQVARVRGELTALGARVLGTRDLAELRDRLLADPARSFGSAAELEARARAALARADSGLSARVRTPMRARCEVRPMENTGTSLFAFYRPAVPDGSRPAYLMLSTARPRARATHELEALVFHEAVPGHHVQVTIAQERAGLPAFRRHAGSTAFAEGWALYAERLADEMGLYSGEVDRLGMLAYDAWRSCRLVVDTGLHALGWSVAEAADFMAENTLLPVSQIHDDLDRSLSWPGQAAAYKVGQLEILRLREEAQRRLGARFDIAAFHEALLRNGAVPLPLLRAEVEAWCARVEGAR
jgi:uncharacterized protein (DUF885 family)